MTDDELLRHVRRIVLEELGAESAVSDAGSASPATPAEEKVPLQVSIPRATAREIRTAARAAEMTLSDFMVWCFDQAMARGQARDLAVPGGRFTNDAGLGTVIAALRRSRGLTQAELGERAGLSRTSITNIEQGNQLLSIPTLQAIATSLDCRLTVSLEPRR